MLPVFLVFFLIDAAECRLKFNFSEFLDGNDLKTVSQVEFACPKGCMVYSATENANLVIINKGTGQEVTNLNLLATNNNANDRSFIYGVTLPPSNYVLNNKLGLTGPVFSLYVVAYDAPNYGQTLRVADAFAAASFSTTAGLMTIMTRGTGIRMVTLNAASAMTPRIFATGYDTTKDGCWPVYNANSLSHAQQSQIDVIGPIATIRFEGLQPLTNATVKVSGDIMTDASETRNSLTISSPGFHGCSRDIPLYQNSMNLLNRKFKSDLQQSVTVHVRSKQWISVDSDAVIISGLQDQPIKLMGEQSYEHDFPVNKVDVDIKWQRINMNSNFALQMDATKSAAASSLLLALACSLFFIV